MESKIQKNLMRIYKQLPQSSLEEDDIKQYIDEVVREVKDHKIILTSVATPAGIIRLSIDELLLLSKS